MRALLEALDLAIPESIQALTRKGGGEALAGYALCTDDDARTLYAAAFRDSDLQKFSMPGCRYVPAEWPLEDGTGAMQVASSAQEAWADAQYAAEPDDRQPDDDHLRPWKGELVKAVTDVLLKHRKQGTIPEGALVFFTSHTPTEWMADRIEEGCRVLNDEALFQQWQPIWREWCC